MSRLPLYRNVKARNQFDLFFVSAITSLLSVRLYLELADYPQVGGDTLHIAHMLPGGLLMMLALLINFTLLGNRTRQISAVIGGVGFGVFIDELGKFITKDNNYFFEPAIGIIYALFVVLYLVFNFITKDKALTSREYQLNALAQLEEAVALDMDKGEREEVYRLLDKADQRSKVTKELRRLVDSVDVASEEHHRRFHKLSRSLDEWYARFWRQKRSHAYVQILFALQAVAIFGTLVFTNYTNINDVSLLFDDQVTYGEELIIGQLLSSGASIVLLIYGLIQLPSSRLMAFEQFRRATLINIYLTQFFAFSRIQFEALYGFAASLIILILLGFIIREEYRLQNSENK